MHNHFRQSFFNILDKITDPNWKNGWPTVDDYVVNEIMKGIARSDMEDAGIDARLIYLRNKAFSQSNSGDKKYVETLLEIINSPLWEN